MKNGLDFNKLINTYTVDRIKETCLSTVSYLLLPSFCSFSSICSFCSISF